MTYYHSHAEMKLITSMKDKFSGKKQCVFHYIKFNDYRIIIFTPEIILSVLNTFNLRFTKN